MRFVCRDPAVTIEPPQRTKYLCYRPSVLDVLTIFEVGTPSKPSKRVIAPEVLVKNGYYEADNIVGEEFHGDTLVLNFVTGYSTTRIIESIKIAKAARRNLQAARGEALRQLGAVAWSMCLFGWSGSILVKPGVWLRYVKFK